MGRKALPTPNKMPRFITFMNYFQTVPMPIGDLCRDLKANGCKAKNYIGVRNHLKANTKSDFIFQFLDEAKRLYDMRKYEWSQEDVDLEAECVIHEWQALNITTKFLYA